MAGNWYDILGVFDLETTGIDVDTSRIVTANVSIIGPDGSVLERTDWMADPGVPIPSQATAVHGITTERAQAQGRPAAEVVDGIIAALRGILDRGIPVVVYNAPYDLSLLNREAVRYGIDPLRDPCPIIDPLVLDRAVDRYRKGKRTLEVASLVYGVILDSAHDAGADAIAAGRVAQAIARQYGEQLGDDVLALHDSQVGWCRDQAASFQEYMRRVKDPAFTADGSWPERIAAPLERELDPIA
jgi:DNA polymerase III subunit epsilon